jgi:hypothetical protein
MNSSIQRTCQRYSFVITSLTLLTAFLIPSEVFASGALSGGGGSGLPFEQGVGVIWNSISQFVAPIAVALGVIIGIILFARGSAGAAVYSLFGFALIGGVALGITQIFNVFGWDGATIGSFNETNIAALHGAP